MSSETFNDILKQKISNRFLSAPEGYYTDLETIREHLVPDKLIIEMIEELDDIIQIYKSGHDEEIGKYRFFKR